jgi:hypothetical protein
MTKSHGSSSEDARIYRQKGHDDAKEFALSIGLTNDYRNDITAKKDVIDPSGDSHSVKSGHKKWQIFLYGQNRFESDDAFVAMNGIGQLLVACINSFPSDFEKYQNNKIEAKNKLRPIMVELAEKLKEKKRLRAFLNKSMFNGGEVNYLTIKHNDMFHVFWNKEVIDIFGDNLLVCNSKARSPGQISEQKVILQYEGQNLGEIEMRNDSEIHYREIRFNMLKPRVIKLLFSNITNYKTYNKRVLVYGEALKHFGNWKKVKKIDI